jgi:hypothetical protein
MYLGCLDRLLVTLARFIKHGVIVSSKECAELLKLPGGEAGRQGFARCLSEAWQMSTGSVRHTLVGHVDSCCMLLIKADAQCLQATCHRPLALQKCSWHARVRGDRPGCVCWRGMQRQIGSSINLKTEVIHLDGCPETVDGPGLQG